MKKKVRSWSGVLVVTIVMKPDKFSCSHNCHYCPNETKANGAQLDMPRSYLSTEPAVMRAMEVNFDTIKQMNSRLNQLSSLGHETDKIEIIVLGGTFSEYPSEYKKEFMTDLFYAANTYGESEPREKYDILKEQRINTDSKHRIIGICIETRPDSICKQELRRLRMFGVTRVQLGVQTTDDTILIKLNRGHNVKQSIHAIKLLKCNGFKVDVHVMPDLPGSSPALDKKMLSDVILGHDFQPDYMKIYPCLDVSFTEIRKWKENGSWKPYAESEFGELVNTIIHAKRISVPWIRFNRIQRDFPEENSNRIGYMSKTIRPNLRQMVQDKCKDIGLTCNCIRCREIKSEEYDWVTYTVKKYRASDGTEYFIQALSNTGKLLGYLRLRINDDENLVIFHELLGGSLIRELHVLGFISPKNSSQNLDCPRVQHRGIGKTLLKISFLITSFHMKKSTSVISGVGVRGYYEKFNFHLKKPYGYMVKNIKLTECIIVLFELLFIVIHIYFCVLLQKIKNIINICASVWKVLEIYD